MLGERISGAEVWQRWPIASTRDSAMSLVRTEGFGAAAEISPDTGDEADAKQGERVSAWALRLQKKYRWVSAWSSFTIKN